MNRQIAGMLVGLSLFSGCGSESQPASQQAVKPENTAKTIAQTTTEKKRETSSEESLPHQKPNLTASATAQAKVDDISLQKAEEFFLRGLEFQKQGKLAESTQELTMAIKLNPQVSRYYFHRGSAWADLKQDASAIVDLTKAIEMDPKNAQYLS